MDTISRRLTMEHRDGDEQFALIEQQVDQQEWAAAEKTFRIFHNLLEAHLSKEEEILFPELEKHMGAAFGPTHVMRMEHQDMRGLLQEMSDSIACRDAAHYLGLSETFLILMQQHNLKEENILYRAADEILHAEQDEIIRRLYS